MKKRDKKAQFYIMAALIISGIIISFAITINVSQKNRMNELYDLGEELKIESDKVLDHGVYNLYNNDEMNDLLMEFAEIYANYKGEKKDLYFVFGNKTRVTLAGYFDSQIEEGSLKEISVEAGSGQLQELDIRENEDYIYANYILDNNDDTLIIKISGIAYLFQLRGNEYFYFIINKKIDGQHYIITNEK